MSNLAPLPLHVQAIAARLVAAALSLEEAASLCAMSPIPDVFDAMLRSMRAMRDALELAEREIAA